MDDQMMAKILRKVMWDALGAEETIAWTRRKIDEMQARGVECLADAIAEAKPGVPIPDDRAAEACFVEAVMHYTGLAAKATQGEADESAYALGLAKAQKVRERFDGTVTAICFAEWAEEAEALLVEQVGRSNYRCRFVQIPPAVLAYCTETSPEEYATGFVNFIRDGAAADPGTEDRKAYENLLTHIEEEDDAAGRE